MFVIFEVVNVEGCIARLSARPTSMTKHILATICERNNTSQLSNEIGNKVSCLQARNVMTKRMTKYIHRLPLIHYHPWKSNIHDSITMCGKVIKLLKIQKIKRYSKARIVNLSLFWHSSDTKMYLK